MVRLCWDTPFLPQKNWCEAKFPPNSTHKIATAIYNITVNKLYLNHRGRRVLQNQQIFEDGALKLLCAVVHISTIAFGNPTKGIVADNHEIFCVFVHRNLSQRISSVLKEAYSEQDSTFFYDFTHS